MDDYSWALFLVLCSLPGYLGLIVRAILRFSFDRDDTDDMFLLRKTCEAVNMNLSYFDGADGPRMKLVTKVLSEGSEFTVDDVQAMKKEIDGMARWVSSRVDKFGGHPESGLVEEMRKEWENREDMMNMLCREWLAELIWASERSCGQVFPQI